MNPKLVLSEKPEKIIQSQGSLQPVREDFFIIFAENLAGISKMVFKQSSLKQGYPYYVPHIKNFVCLHICWLVLSLVIYIS